MGRIKSNLSEISEYPTRQCLICDRMEYPNAWIVDHGKVWLCPICKAVLGRLVEEAVTRGDGDD